VLCTCIFHYVQLLSARKGVHVLATPTHQEAAAGTGNAAAADDDDRHDDHAGNGTPNRFGMAWDGMVWHGYAIAMKRAMSELGVWHIKRWHRTGSQHMLDI